MGIVDRTVTVLAFCLISNAAAAQTSTDRAPLLDDLLSCRIVTDSGERLACFDRATAAFATAESEGQVTVVDQAQAQRTRQRLFGLDLGSANIFGGLRFEGPVEAIQTTLQSARQDQNGRWIFTLADGSVWRQIDTERLNTRPAPGAAVRVRQAAIGSYMLSVGGARSVRARREQ